MSDQTSADSALPECGHYELLRPLEDNSLQYNAGDVLEFNCEEAAFLKAHGYIWATSPKPLTRKRLIPSRCGGCGSTLINEPAPESALADSAAAVSA